MDLRGSVLFPALIAAAVEKQLGKQALEKPAPLAVLLSRAFQSPENWCWSACSRRLLQIQGNQVSPSTEISSSLAGHALRVSVEVVRQ